MADDKQPQGDLDSLDFERLEELMGREELPQSITESYGTGVHDQPGFTSSEDYPERGNESL